MERLNYKGTKQIPSIFSENEVLKIILEPLNCSNYWHSKGSKEWAKFLKARDVTILATIYILGLRPKCACCLRFDDFDFRTSTVHIRGENNKTGKDRVLPLPANLLNFYRNYLSYPRARFWKGSKYLFPTFTTEHITPAHLKYIMREKVLKPLGIWQAPIDNKKSKFSLYTLRHSRASHLLNKQIDKNGQPDIYAIANLLGHSDIRSTTVYLHTDEKYTKYLRDLLSM